MRGTTSGKQPIKSPAGPRLMFVSIKRENTRVIPKATLLFHDNQFESQVKYDCVEKNQTELLMDYDGGKTQK